MARRSSKPEEEKNAGKRVEPTESMPEPDTSEQFGEKRIEAMPSDSDFEDQTAVNKGRFFATVGTGRPSEMREITDDQLQALNSPGFPVADQQVGQFLGEMAEQDTSEQFMVKDPTSEPMPVDLKELDDEDDWNEPEDRLDKADMHDEDEDDEED